MNLSRNEDQNSIKDTAAQFFDRALPIAAMRRLRDSQDALSYDPEAWRQMVELGFSAVTIAEDCGGLGLDYVCLGGIFEEAGRRLSHSPLFSSLVLGASLIELAGSEQQKQTLLPQIADGSLQLTVAVDEATHHQAANICAEARRQGEGYVLSGSKRAVLNADSAELILCVARDTDRGGVSVFIVERNCAGLHSEPLTVIDHRAASNLRFENIALPATALLGEAGQAGAAVETMLDRARAIQAAEMLGGCQELFDRSMAYLREREQFGAPIGSFQALQHRAAKWFTELELSRSAVIAALAAIDEQHADTAALVSLAKARANDCYLLSSNEAVQLHGGIGVTDELDIGLFLKRARVAIQQWGDSRFHRSRYATLQGY